ncbi:MAG TPA: acetamidase/formamidase family protein [Jatrophihabitantaceae bacterium]|jgi:acetamidase/formamidase
MTAHIPSTVDTLRWGRLPARDAAAVAKVAPGETFSVDTLSHEGVLEDQGRDPLAYFRSRGVAEADVLPDLVTAIPSLSHDPAVDGPHLVTGPVFVDGAQPGDLLQVDIVGLERRTDYGVISDRHAKDVFAADESSRPAGMSSGGLVSTFCRVEREHAVLEGDSRLRVPLAPFLGIVGVATDTPDEQHSGPPGRHGGNLDLRHLVAGTSLYLPVQVPGALLYAGDPHFVQGNGELASTALEAPLRATLRVHVHRDAPVLDAPVGVTPRAWIVCGLDRDLGRAVRAASAAAVRLLGGVGLTPDLALAWLSVAGDVEVTQVVDGVLGAHVVIPRNLDLLPEAP